MALHKKAEPNSPYDISNRHFSFAVLISWGLFPTASEDSSNTRVVALHVKKIHIFLFNFLIFEVVCSKDAGCLYGIFNGPWQRARATMLEARALQKVTLHKIKDTNARKKGKKNTSEETSLDHGLLQVRLWIYHLFLFHN
ncbi:hypothetical protein ACJX0J_025718, partial [Zea mays]